MNLRLTLKTCFNVKQVFTSTEGTYKRLRDGGTRITTLNPDQSCYHSRPFGKEP